MYIKKEHIEEKQDKLFAVLLRDTMYRAFVVLFRAEDS